MTSNKRSAVMRFPRAALVGKKTFLSWRSVDGRLFYEDEVLLKKIRNVDLHLVDFEISPNPADVTRIILAIEINRQVRVIGHAGRPGAPLGR